QVSVTLGYDEPLAHRITAGCDLFVMPSRFEPCGLNQMYSLRYGTLPLVHKVGGLKDTVFDADQAPPDKANGFSFEQITQEGFQLALARSLECYHKPKRWRRLQANGMAGDYSWTNSGQAYRAVYQQA